jgi:endo-1,4-beta-xylanase
VAGFFWGSNSSRPNTYDFTRPDNFAKFASDNKILFRGHPLVWHKSNPKWLVKKFKDPDTTASEIERILTDHVSRLVRHYAGRVHSWDVVNEAINVADGRSDGLRTAPWLKFLGPEYIDLAFRTAAEADPKALLVYNDNRIAYGGSGEHRAGVLKLLERLKSRGIPIHALGDTSSPIQP